MSLGQTPSAITVIPVLQGGSFNTQSDQTDHVQQDLALTSVNQPVQSASTGETTQLNQSTKPEPPLDEVIRRAKTPDLSVESTAANRNVAIGVIDHGNEHQRVRMMGKAFSATVDDPVSILGEEQPVEDPLSVLGEEPQTASFFRSSSKASIDSMKRPAMSLHGKSEVFDKGASARDIATNVEERITQRVKKKRQQKPTEARSSNVAIRAQSRGRSSTRIIAEVPDGSQLSPNISNPDIGVFDAVPPISDSMIVQVDRSREIYYTPWEHPLPETEAWPLSQSYPISKSPRPISPAPPAYIEYREARQSPVTEVYDKPRTDFLNKGAEPMLDMSDITTRVDGPVSQRVSPTGSHSSSPTSETRFHYDSGPKSSPAQGQRGVRRYFADLKKKVTEPKKKAAVPWKKLPDVTTNNPVFGVAPVESIPYANVAISLLNQEGESFIYGYIPTIVAECGAFLKKRGTVHPNILTLGNEDNVARLIIAFNSPPHNDKRVDWADYSVLDASTVLYRYLRSLPEPLITPDCFRRMMFLPIKEPFRNPSSPERQHLVARYQLALTQLQSPNRELVLYLLDLFSVFAGKSELNGAYTDVIVGHYLTVFFLEDKANLELSMRQRFALGFMIDYQDNISLGFV